MQDFASLRHITIGQYLPGESVIHRLDPRTKLTIVLLLTIAMTVNTSYLANGILLLLCLGLLWASQISAKYVLGTVRPALPVLIFLAIFQMLFLGTTSVTTTLPVVVFFEWGPIVIGSAGIQLVFVLWARFLLLTILASVLTNTTPMAYLAYGIEDLLRPFSRFGLPAQEISLIGTIALRFVPILSEGLETIMKAQASRGADLGTGGRLNFIRTTRAVLVLIVPLFLDAFRRAEDLIVAMEARCYAGGKGRTRLVQLHFMGMDWALLITFLAITAALVAFRTRFPF